MGQVDGCSKNASRTSIIFKIHQATNPSHYT